VEHRRADAGPPRPVALRTLRSRCFRTLTAATIRGPYPGGQS
jgi:hypothetical protein